MENKPSEFQELVEEFLKETSQNVLTIEKLEAAFKQLVESQGKHYEEPE